METDLSQERVRELFDYDSENGWLIRKFKNGKRKPCGINPNSAGYGMVGIDGKIYYPHRVIWLWHKGSWPEHEIDHINQNKMDNRIENLRSVTRSENQHNHGLHRDNSSGYPGVCFDKQANKYKAQIMDNSKQIYLGYFDTPEEAYRAYQLAKIKYHPTSPAAQQYKQELGIIA